MVKLDLKIGRAAGKKAATNTTNAASILGQLVAHIVRASAQIDRTKLNNALVEAMAELFHPQRLAIYRVFTGHEQAMLFDCAGIGTQGPYLRNAYLAESQYCQPVDSDPLLMRCLGECAVLHDTAASGANRMVLPIAAAGSLRYLIDIDLAAPLTAAQENVLDGLLSYFGNHVVLLDYGETDALTRLPNRKTFERHLFEVLGHAAIDEPAPLRGKAAPRRRKGSDVSHYWLAVCDIDHFKNVNDNHGHLVGDEVLVAVAQLMRESFRYHDQLFRFGGEEFVVVMQPTSPQAAVQAFERFRKRIAEHVFPTVGHLSISIGYSQLAADDTAAQAVERADEALYYVKQHGRNSVSCYEDRIVALKGGIFGM